MVGYPIWTYWNSLLQMPHEEGANLQRFLRRRWIHASGWIAGWESSWVSQESSVFVGTTLPICTHKKPHIQGKTCLNNLTQQQQQSMHSKHMVLWAFTQRCKPIPALKFRLQRAGYSFKLDAMSNILLRKVKFPDPLWLRECEKMNMGISFQILWLGGETHFTYFLKLIQKAKQQKESNIESGAPVKCLLGVKCCLVSEQLYSAATCAPRWSYIVVLPWKLTL